MSSSSAEANWAVVVGGSGALGSAIALRLAAASLRVLVVGRRPEALTAISEAHPFVTTAVCDIATDESIQVIKDAVGGPVRMVVQAAGLPQSGPLATIDPAALGDAINLKLGGLLRALQAVDDRLSAGARIVALGGHFGTEPSPSASAAGITNAALANLNRQLADVFGPRGITSHLVSPGAVESERLRGVAARVASARGITEAEAMEDLISESPLGRLTTAQEVAWAVDLLLHQEAGALTGGTISLDSGQRRGIG